MFTATADAAQQVRGRVAAPARRGAGPGPLQAPLLAAGALRRRLPRESRVQRGQTRRRQQRCRCDVS